MPDSLRRVLLAAQLPRSAQVRLSDWPRYGFSFVLKANLPDTSVVVIGAYASIPYFPLSVLEVLHAIPGDVCNDASTLI